jgi:CubicO group peptidase (beta-lactamase class C family)
MKLCSTLCLTISLTIAAHGEVCPITPLPQAKDLNRSIAETERYLQCLQSATSTPGLAVAIVYKDRVVLLKGYGVRKVGETQKIDADTIFEIASFSKPIAATIVASLVGTGDLSWDDRIATLDPGFQLSDPRVTSQVALRDLFSHRSGLPGHSGDDLEELGYTRLDVLSRLRYLPLTGKFRETYAYTNFGFTEAAIAASDKMGRRWEDLADDLLFSRLGMTHSSYRFSDYQNASNKAALHVFEEGHPVNHYVRDADAEAPAGGASASARDLSQWLRLQIADGRWAGKQMIDSRALNETRKPIICTSMSPDGVCSPEYGYYGLGWDVNTDKTSHTTLSHSGAFFLGASTTVRLLPDEGVGILVLSNTAPIGVPESIALTFMDLFEFGKLRMPGWFEVVNPIFTNMVASAENASPNYSKLPAPASPSASHPLATYLGRYFNRYFGTVEIVKEGDSLAMLLPPLGAHYDLQHWDGDTFTYYIAGESSGIGRRGVKFSEGQSGPALLLQNYVAKDDSGKVYQDGVFVKVGN